MTSQAHFLICFSLLIVTFVFILPPARGGTVPIQTGGAGLDESNGRDRGIGYKRCENCTTTEYPYPFPPRDAQPEFRIKPGKDMPVDEQFDDEYYKDYDFEFAKTGHDSPNFEQLIKENQKYKSYEFNSIEEMDAQAEFPALWRKMYCSGDSPYDMEMLCNTIDALLLGENIENEEHREQVVKYKRWY